MKTFTIIGGVNGVGKSSLSGVLRTQQNNLGIIIDADRIALEKAGGDNLKGGKLAVQLIRDCLNRGVCFSQETTLNGFTTAKKAYELGYYIRMYYVGLDSLDESIQRIENRVLHGGHNIEKNIVSRRFASRWAAVADVLPYCNEAIFYDNYNGFAVVAEYQNGTLMLKGDYRPAWILELKAYLNQ